MEQQLTIWIGHVRPRSHRRSRAAGTRTAAGAGAAAAHPGLDRGTRHRPGQPPTEVHAGHCRAAGKRRRAISRDQARALLADGIRACSRCRPDTCFGVLG
ncbi:DUF6233 domain-containing protein [Streptomyces sp. NPDC053720]|uniref:DUF6233 domain-containing protein n=1 Tax=Streptomyces sp. NPDC053720 TaxID=3154855 RepID=UPI003423AE55